MNHYMIYSDTGTFQNQYKNKIKDINNFEYSNLNCYFRMKIDFYKNLISFQDLKRIKYFETFDLETKKYLDILEIIKENKNINELILWGNVCDSNNIVNIPDTIDTITFHKEFNVRDSDRFLLHVIFDIKNIVTIKGGSKIFDSFDYRNKYVKNLVLYDCHNHFSNDFIKNNKILEHLTIYEKYYKYININNLKKLTVILELNSFYLNNEIINNLNDSSLECFEVYIFNQRFDISKLYNQIEKIKRKNIFKLFVDDKLIQILISDFLNFEFFDLFLFYL
jgi:hypothetical protein